MQPLPRDAPTVPAAPPAAVAPATNGSATPAPAAPAPATEAPAAAPATAATDATPGARRPGVTLAVPAIVVAGWLALAWLALDMAHPLARLAMPGTARWSAANLFAVWTMWAVMMAAMMLPSALPMVRAFVGLSARGREPARGRAFVAAYLAVWAAFGTAATAAQWALQAAGGVDPMAASTSAPLTAALLLVAGAYQFTPLKRACLARCRTPLGFLLGEWRPGTAGAFRMGARHGVQCVGCCWALMALLFVGGAMNLAWVAALALAVAAEKLLPGGGRLAAVARRGADRCRGGEGGVAGDGGLSVVRGRNGRCRRQLDRPQRGRRTSG